MKKIFMLIAFLLFAPLGASALEPNYAIDGFYVKAEVAQNGDMLVKEQIVMNGAFNGYVRDLSYKGNYELYDASSLEIEKVCELPYAMAGRFDFNDSSLKYFALADYASSGDSYVYEKTDSDNKVSLKMYNYNESGARIFYIEYLLKNVVVIHNDVAELYWTFIGENFSDDIKDAKITIDLPSQVTDLRAWAHGPLYGNVERKDNQQVYVTIHDLPANTLVDVRSTFDKSAVSLGSKIANDTALPSILKTEQQRADEANRKRAVADVINYGLIGLNVIWVIGALMLGIYAYRKYDKEYKSSFKLKYYREFPGTYGPEVVEYLLKRNITPLSLSATVLNIIRKKGFDVREEEGSHNKKEYVLIKKDTGFKEALTEEETYVVDWFISEYGNGNEVSLKAINDASKELSSAKDFVKKYDKWVTFAKKNGEREEFYEDNLGFKTKMVLYGILGFVLFLISNSLAIESSALFFTLITAIIFTIYVICIKRRTIKGNDHFVKWMAFKKFLLDFGRFNEKELPEIVLWDKYLVYAVIFGIADKVSNAMAIKIKDMNVDTNMSIYPQIFMYNYFTDNLTHTINTTRSMSVSKIAESTRSSGSGFGGGFSGGGGFGGGGVGGGGHGF